MRRRSFLGTGLAGSLGLWLAACSEDGSGTTTGGSTVNNGSTSDADLPDLSTVRDRGLYMPSEEEPHDATWMCFPGRPDVWGRDLHGVQASIADIALAIARFEPVRMLVAPEDTEIAADLVGSDVELLEAPVDDLWARDTLPLSSCRTTATSLRAESGSTVGAASRCTTVTRPSQGSWPTCSASN